MYGLDRVDHLIEIVAKQSDPNALLQSRLTDDMLDLRNQLSIAIGFTLRTVLPLCGRENIDLGIAESLDDLRELLAKARITLGQINSNDLIGEDQSISHQAGFADLIQCPVDYAGQFAIPNMWFHISMAYAILRLNGVKISKGDFDGLHSYSAEFSFD